MANRNRVIVEEGTLTYTYTTASKLPGGTLVLMQSGAYAIVVEDNTRFGKKFFVNFEDGAAIVDTSLGRALNPGSNLVLKTP